MSQIQTRISPARALLVTLESRVPSLDTAFSQPVHVHRIDPAYGAAFGGPKTNELVTRVRIKRAGKAFQ
jgi:hypothetical protein